MKRAVLLPEAHLPPLDGVIPQWPGRPVSVDGSVTYVRHTPPRAPGLEPALYVHGLGGSSLNWTDLAYLLADRVDGEAIDLPGFGQSDPAKSYSIAALAQRVIRWIEHRDRGPVHLFGNSLGGAVSVWVAGTRPDLVRTLTLISPAMPFIDPRRSVQARMLPLLFVPKADRIAARRLAAIKAEDLARQVIEACYYDPSLLTPERLAEAVEEIERRFESPWFLDAYVRSLRGLLGTFVRSYLPLPTSMWRIASQITAPALVVAGRQDRLVDVRTAPAAAKAIPDSRLLILDKVGHVAQMERPTIVARAVGALLEEYASRSQAAALPEAGAANAA